MHMLCTSHFYCCYLHMYMSSAYYLSISILCTHYLQWSLIHSFLTDNADVIHMSSLVLFIYPIMYNLVSTHCLHTCILSMSSVYCLEMHMLCTCHLYCCYLYMYMSSTYYLGIYVLCAHYLQWSLISSFLTDNTNVIHTSSLVVFIHSIMENMSSAPLLDDMSSTPLWDDVSSAPLLDDVSSAPLPDDVSFVPLPNDVSSAPLPDDMSSALQRNMSYLFEV